MKNHHFGKIGGLRRALVITVTLALASGAAEVSYASGSFATPADESARGADRSRWVVRGGPQWMIPTGDEAGDLTIVPGLSEGESRDKQVSGDLGFGFEVEYMLTRRIGIEATAHVGDFGAELTLETDAGRSTDSRDFGFAAVTLGVNYHFMLDGRADFYMGAFAQRSDYDNVTHQFPELVRSAEVTFDEALGWGLKAGVDVPFGPDSPWFIGFSIRHLREPLDVKPVFGSVFIGYRLR